jgi:hypothetical protein
VNKELEALKEEYLAQISGVFPLYRATLLFIALVVVVAVQDFKFKSVSESLLHLPLRSFADLDEGFFAAVTVQDGLLAIGLLLLGAILHRFLRTLFFARLKKVLSLDAVAKEMNEKSTESKDETITSYFALRRSESQAKEWGRRISSLALISESAFTLFLTFLYAGYFGNLVDYAVGLGFLVLAVLALARSFMVFLKKYLPHTMHVKGLLGLNGGVALP